LELAPPHTYRKNTRNGSVAESMGVEDNVQRVCLIHWNRVEAEERAARLRSAGYDVDHETLDSDGLRALRRDPPDAVVVDLTRLSSHGRDLALAIRGNKSTRHVPLIFVDGDPKKVARIKEILPDAVYSTWNEIDGALERAIGDPPTDPVVPTSVFAGYSGTPLPKKLGIKANSAVVVVDAPEGFEETLGDLPDGVILSREADDQPDVTLWFTRSRAELESGIGRMSDFAGEGKLWIAWPKKASRMVTDLSQQHVRKVGLGAGLVDYKICAIDATWSGLLFTRRRRKPK
jgi:CheY-like chemotaxis protein